jgi:hypothetical protein
MIGVLQVVDSHGLPVETHEVRAIDTRLGWVALTSGVVLPVARVHYSPDVGAYRIAERDFLDGVREYETTMALSKGREAKATARRAAIVGSHRAAAGIALSEQLLADAAAKATEAAALDAAADGNFGGVHDTPVTLERHTARFTAPAGFSLTDLAAMTADATSAMTRASLASVGGPSAPATAPKVGDPADATPTTTGGVQRRAGAGTVLFQGQEYSRLEWVLRAAAKGGTLAGSESLLLYEHLKEVTDRADALRLKAGSLKARVEVLESVVEAVGTVDLSRSAVDETVYFTFGVSRGALKAAYNPEQLFTAGVQNAMAAFREHVAAASPAVPSSPSRSAL